MPGDLGIGGPNSGEDRSPVPWTTGLATCTPFTSEKRWGAGRPAWPEAHVGEWT